MVLFSLYKSVGTDWEDELQRVRSGGAEMLVTAPVCLPHSDEFYENEMKPTYQTTTASAFVKSSHCFCSETLLFIISGVDATLGCPFCPPEYLPRVGSCLQCRERSGEGGLGAGKAHTSLPAAWLRQEVGHNPRIQD